MRRLITLIIGLAMALGTLSVPAQASPPTIVGLDQLRTLLDANPNGIPGYFLTVPGGPTLIQQSPVEVPMTVLAVADRTGPDGALIMFRADMTDPLMSSIGNIAAGMSGSPLFIKDGGTDTMIGALSYGYEFTINGLGLATPIEYMIATQNEFPAASNATLDLDRAVVLEGRTIRSVRVSATARAAAAADTVTLRPLFGLQVSGVPAASPAFKRFARTATGKGALVLPGGDGQCTRAGFSAPYQPGGSIGVYFTTGSVEVGGYGTVTYVDGGTAMAFGHPMEWLGQTDLFATNAWISGIWGSSQAAFKVGCPGQLQGSLTQDRSAGVGVDLNATTHSVPATADITIVAGGTRSGTAATQIARGAFDAGYGPSAAEMAVVEPVYRLANQAAMAGSARTTTTVKVGSYTITRPDVWSAADVLGVTGLDAYNMVGWLQSVPGITADIESVHVDAAIEKTSRTAAIVGVRGGPLQTGQNTVTVILQLAGGAAVEVPVTFTVPNQAVVDAGLSVEAGSTYAGEDFTIPTVGSLGALVDWINSVPSNNQILLSMSDASGNPVEVGRASTDFYLEGGAFPQVASGQLVADVSQAMIGDPVTLTAAPTSVPIGATITLEQRVGGATTWQPVGTSPMVTSPDGFTAATFGVTAQANTTYRASWPGSAEVLGWSSTTDVAVSAPVDIEGVRRGAGWRLDVSSVPAVAGSAVSVQAKRNGSWQDVTTGVLGADGTTRLTWRTGPATVKVRAVLPGTARFTAAKSAATTLRALTLVINPDAKPTVKGNVTVGLRDSQGRAVTGVQYRVQRRTNDRWEPAASGRLGKTVRVWLANGDYRVTVPKQRGVQAVTRDTVTVSSATITITRARGGRGRASVAALPPIPLRFTVQKLQSGQWLSVGGVRRMSPPKMSWARALKPGRYRFAFGQQHRFDAAVSAPVRVR